MVGIGIWQLLMVAVIVVVVFGSKKLRTLGADLGASIKGFKKAINDDTTTSSNQIDKTIDDADFPSKTITDRQPEIKIEESKSQNKEQV